MHLYGTFILLKDIYLYVLSHSHFVISIRNEFAKNVNIFLSVFNNRMERTQSYRIIRDAGREVGIDYKIGTHTLRKTFGYHHYKKFKDIALLQEIFNHSSPSITLRYIGVNQDRIDVTYRSFSL